MERVQRDFLVNGFVHIIYEVGEIRTRNEQIAQKSDQQECMGSAACGDG